MKTLFWGLHCNCLYPGYGNKTLPDNEKNAREINKNI